MGHCTNAIVRVGAWGVISGVLIGVARHTHGTLAIFASGLAGIALLIAGLEIMTPEAPPSGTCTVEVTTTADQARWELRIEVTSPSMTGDFVICEPYIHSFQAWTQFADGQRDELRLSLDDVYITIINMRNKTACIPLGHNRVATGRICVPWGVFSKALRKAINRAADRGLQFAE